VRRRHLVAVVGRLYPRAWRRRYGEELADLCDEYLDEGESTPARLALGLSVSALGERARAVGSRPRGRSLVTGIALVAVASTGAATNAFGLLARRPTATTPGASASVRPSSPGTGAYAVTLSCTTKALEVEGVTVSAVAPPPGRVVMAKPGRLTGARVPSCTVSVHPRY
jgi:hypothetical protein